MGQKENCGRSAFVKRLQAEDNSITAEEGGIIYDTLDAVLALLAIPEGKRIIINKADKADRN